MGKKQQIAKTKVIVGVQAGQTLQQAVGSAGVSLSTVARWRKRDRGFDQQVIAAMQPATPRADFAEAMVGAVASGIADTPDKVFAAASLAGSVGRSREELAEFTAEQIRDTPDLTFADLNKLADSPSEDIQLAIIGHRNVHGAVLHWLGTSEKSSGDVVRAVLDHPSTREETYQDIYSMSKWDVSLAGSKRTPKELLLRLAISHHLPTQEAARATLSEMGLL